MASDRRKTMLDNMICWTIVTTESYREGDPIKPYDWEYAAATFKDGIAVIIHKDRRMGGIGAGSSPGIIAGIWEADLETGKAIHRIGETGVPEYWAEDLTTKEALRKTCVAIKAMFDNRNGEFYKKIKEAEKQHAGVLIQRYRENDNGF